MLKRKEIVYLYRKNLKIKQLSTKLDFVKVRLYKVIKQTRFINYKLKLLAQLYIYLIFYILLLERAPLDAKPKTI